MESKVERTADHEVDATKMWQEITDPSAEFDEQCAAYFTTEWTYGFDGNNPEPTGRVIAARLIGISVDDGHGAKEYDREAAIYLLGMDAVDALEEEQSRILTEEME